MTQTDLRRGGPETSVETGADLAQYKGDAIAVGVFSESELSPAARALDAVEAMLLFAPEANHLWRDAGVLHAKLGQLGGAVRSLERYLARSGAGPARDEAERMLSRVRAELN